MTSIYLAGPWKRREEVRKTRDVLVKAGFNITSRWLDAPDLDQTNADSMVQEAKHDLEDILDADIMIVDNLEVSEGKSVEQGIALILDIPIIVIGKRSNVFQYMPQVTNVATVDEALKEMENAGISNRGN